MVQKKPQKLLGPLEKNKRKFIKDKNLGPLPAHFFLLN